MAQWDVHRSEGGLFLNVQSDLLEGTTTRIVVPLLPSQAPSTAQGRLTPMVVAGDPRLHAHVLSLAAIPISRLGPRIASAEHARDDVTRALDLVLSGT